MSFPCIFKKKKSITSNYDANLSKVKQQNILHDLTLDLRRCKVESFASDPEVRGSRGAEPLSICTASETKAFIEVCDTLQLKSILAILAHSSKKIFPFLIFFSGVKKKNSVSVSDIYKNKKK